MADEFRTVASIKDTKILPRGSTLAMVMTGGYERGCIDYAILRRERRVDRCIMLSYSSPRGDNRSFSTGRSMRGNIYIPRADAKILRDNRDAPLILVDNCSTTGITMAAVGKSIKMKFGYRGKIYQDTAGVVERWSGSVTNSASYIPTNVPIFTEYGALFKKSEMTRKELQLVWHRLGGKH